MASAPSSKSYGSHMMRDVDDCHFRIDLQDDAFQRPHQMIVRSVVRCECDDGVRQWILPPWVLSGEAAQAKWGGASYLFTLTNRCRAVKNARRHAM